jgi:cytoskeleton protein RodZ
MEYQPVKSPIEQGGYLSFRPGERLKKAREAKGFSLEQVSSTLKILPRMLEAIEKDSYKDLPEPVFVRGYLRLYADLVALPSEDIIARFDEYYTADTGRSPQVRLQSPQQQHLPDISPRRLPTVKWGAVGGVALLVVLALASVAVWQSALPQKVMAWFQTTPSTAPVADTPATTNTINLPNTSTTQQAIDTLELSFTANTKVLIRDSSGKELANGEKVAGDTLTVTGESPFAIELNPAAAVQFQFNQKPIDLKPYTVNGVVNFRLSR